MVIFPFVIAFITSLGLVPLCKKLAFRFDILDRPSDALKIHRKPIPYLGGVAIACSFFIAAIIYTTFINPAFEIRLILILVSAFVAMLLGLADDVRNVNPILRLCGEILAALLLVFAGLTVSAVPFAPIAIFLTFFIVLASINSVNLIDGFDGLAAGTTIIASAGFFVLSIQNQSNLGIILSLALMGSALAFLLYNFNPASIFMGDAGSYFLGCALAILFVLNTGKSPPSPPLIKGGIRGGDFNSLIASALIMGVFIFDTGLAIMRRWLNGRPIFQGDRSHFYDQLKDRGLSTIQTVVVCYAVEAAFVILGLTAKQLPLMWAMVLLFFVAAVCASFIMKFGMLKMEK